MLLKIDNHTIINTDKISYIRMLYEKDEVDSKNLVLSEIKIYLENEICCRLVGATANQTLINLLQFMSQ